MGWANIVVDHASHVPQLSLATIVLLGLINYRYCELTPTRALVIVYSVAVPYLCCDSTLYKLEQAGRSCKLSL